MYKLARCHHNLIQEGNVAVGNTNTKTLENEIDQAMKEIVDEVINHENLEIIAATKENNIPLENPEKIKIIVEEENLQKDVDTSKNDSQLDFGDMFSDVKQILDEVLDQVNEITTCEKMEFPGEKDTNSEKMDSSGEKGVTEGSANGQKHGLKRTHDQSDGQVINSNKDSSYIMSLVQDELDAVKEQLNTGEKTKLVDYDSDSSDSCDEKSSSSESSSSDSESSTSSEESSIDERMIIDKIECEEDKVHVDPPKTKDEILLNDLPPEPLLDIVLPDDVKLVHIGVITNIVEAVVVIRALPKIPVVDADTLLFLENRKCLGKVFETFGPVQCPFYSVRFNSPDDLTKAEVKPDLMVFFAPEELDFTKLIFTSQIEKFKGSDASWKHDQEPPTELVEYSDDEEEAKSKAKKKQARKANKPSTQGQKDSTEMSFEAASSLQANKVAEHPRTWQGRGRGRNMQGNHPRQPFSGLPPQAHPGGPPPGHFPPPPFQYGHHAPPHIPPPSLLPPPHRPPPPHPGQYYPPPPLPPPGYPSRPPPPYADMTYRPPPPPVSSPWPSFNYRPPQQ